VADRLLRWPTWIGVVVDDLDGQRRFWADVLGLPEDHSGSDFVSFKTAEGYWFELLQRSNDPEYDRRRFQVGFEVEDIETAYRELIDRGVEAITEIYAGDEPWAYFRDPEGNVFEIKQRAPGDAARDEADSSKADGNGFAGK
jgi:catechol 2,3-dioxygenase-like lactoylglutathione lyase family enzyme